MPFPVEREFTQLRDFLFDKNGFANVKWELKIAIIFFIYNSKFSNTLIAFILGATSILF